MNNWLNDWENDKDEREQDFSEKINEHVNTAIQNNELVVTRRGVYKNLNLSPFEIQLKDKVLKFSSLAKMNKFADEMKIKSMQLERSFKRLYGENFDRLKTNFDGLVRSLYISSYNKLKLK